MARRVYEHQKQFKDAVELEEIVCVLWECLSHGYFTKIYRSIPRRHIQAIDRNG